MKAADAIETMKRKRVVRLAPEDAKLASLKRYARWAAEEEAELVFEFAGDVPPDRILKFVEWANEEYQVKALIRHAELKEYVTHVAVGAGLGVAAVLLAKAAGWVISWPVALAAVAVATVIAIGATPLHIKIYKHRGAVRLRLAPSA